MKIMKTVTASILMTVLTACAVNTPKNYGAQGGSKSDGTVKMAYTYGAFEKPIVDEAQALRDAQKRCISWGYKGAESFDFESKVCQSMDSYGSCYLWLVSKEFQCN